MAVTKTHPIKSTLKAAIDYILNPEKTDGKLLASSFGCGLETADIEFAWTREAAGDRGTHLGRHLIQSFAVGETTPEEAHKIGMELAGAVSKQAGEQRDKGKADKGNAAARHQLFHALRLRAGVIVAVPLHEVNAAPNAKSCAKRDYQSLQYVNCAVEKIHINLAFCR